MIKKENIINSYTFNPCKIIARSGTRVELTLKVDFIVYWDSSLVEMQVKVIGLVGEEVTRLVYSFDLNTLTNDNIIERLYDYSIRRNVCFKLILNNCNFLDEEEREFYRLIYI